jgi:hypothetical protein
MIVKAHSFIEISPAIMYRTALSLSCLFQELTLLAAVNHLTSHLEFQDLQRGPQGAAARRDFETYPTFVGKVWLEPKGRPSEMVVTGIGLEQMLVQYASTRNRRRASVLQRLSYSGRHLYSERDFHVVIAAKRFVAIRAFSRS